MALTLTWLESSDMKSKLLFNLYETYPDLTKLVQ